MPWIGKNSLKYSFNYKFKLQSDAACDISAVVIQMYQGYT